MSRTFSRLLTVSLLVCVVSDNLRGEALSAESRNAKLCRLVVAGLEATHLSGRPLDDSLAHRLLDLFLDDLDPDRLYFLASDVEEFRAEGDTLDERLAAGDVEFARRVHRRLLERLEARAKELGESVAAEDDLDADEYHFADRRLAEHPTADDVAEVCRKHVKFLLLERRATGASLPEARKAVARHLEEQHRRLRDLDADRLTAMYLAAAASAYDPHTRYLPPASVKELETSLALRLVGIGAHLRSEDGATVVTKLVPGGPAARDGHLKPDDRIVAVGEGAKGKLTDVRDASLGSVVRRIRGAAGTTVRLRVLRGDGSPEVIAIRRAPVELVDGLARGRTRRIGAGGKSELTIGIIDLPAFYGTSSDASQKTGSRRLSSADDVAAILDGFQEQQVDAVILDLRRNTGGLLEEALGVAGLFVDAGPLLQIKGRAETEILFDPRPGAAWNGPLAVLTSPLTASAAEVVAGALKDYRRALVVGAGATFGKGTVQSLVKLGDGSEPEPDARKLGALKVTVSRFYRPLGDSTQERGVAADLRLPAVATARGESSRPGALAFDRLPALDIEPYDLVPPRMTAKLALLSEKRLETSDHFEHRRDAIARVARTRDRKWVRLSLNDVRAYTEGRKTVLPGASTDAGDAALDEAVEITRDYVLALEAGVKG